MLCLAVVLLSCGALCLASPVPPTAETRCAVSSLILETLSDVKKLHSKGNSKITPPNDMMEAGGDVITYLQGFIEAFESSEENLEGRIARKLQKIQDARKSCPGWTEHHWKPDKEEVFFSNLEYLLKSLRHHDPSAETV